MVTLNDTPSASRLHILLAGKRNSGKSSLLNALVGQSVAIVSAQPGTTTDPVFKPMEINGLGPCVLIDTAGIDDVGSIGEKRVDKTMQALRTADMVIVVTQPGDDAAGLLQHLRFVNVPVLTVLNKIDTVENRSEAVAEAERNAGCRVIPVSAVTGEGIDVLRSAMIQAMPKDCSASILGGLVGEGDRVLLVMPQDKQAPQGRLILPQQQTLRELLDKECIVTCCTADGYERTLASLKEPPQLIVTDSQAFDRVFSAKPALSKLTSFSILFAAYKGDIRYFVESARVISRLNASSRVLIAEACSHVPLQEDIGRVKLPRMLRAKAGEGIRIDIVSGKDFPEHLTDYQLIVHCGACMFRRNLMIGRVEMARRQHVPMTNYGVAMAYMQGILDKVTLP